MPKMERQKSAFNGLEALMSGCVAKAPIFSKCSRLSGEKPFSNSIDIETIQYELSGDMEVQSLVKKLMVLLLRISGSSHVVVELVEGTGDRIRYDQLSLLPEGDEKQASMPKSMMLMALKSQNVVIVNELTTERALRDVDALQ